MPKHRRRPARELREASVWATVSVGLVPGVLLLAGWPWRQAVLAGVLLLAVLLAVGVSFALGGIRLPHLEEPPAAPPSPGDGTHLPTP